MYGVYLRQPLQLLAWQEAQLDRDTGRALSLLGLDIANTDSLRRTRWLAQLGHLILALDDRTSCSKSAPHR